MAILARIIKIFKADIHGVMDHLEDRGLLLKQHLRDMEDALYHKADNLAKIRAFRNQGQKDLAGYKQQMDALEHDLTVAVRKKRDDIARMLIRKIKPLENLIAELACQLRTWDDEMLEVNNQLQRQRQKYAQFKYRIAQYRQKTPMQQWEKDAISPVSDNGYGQPTDQEVDLELMKRKEALGAAAKSIDSQIR
jgi:phage shock protein A